MHRRLVAGTTVLHSDGGYGRTCAVRRRIHGDGPQHNDAAYVLPVARGVDITSLRPSPTPALKVTGSRWSASPTALAPAGARPGGGGLQQPGAGDVGRSPARPRSEGGVRHPRHHRLDHERGDCRRRPHPAGGPVLQLPHRHLLPAPNAAGTNPSTGKAFPTYGPAFSRFCSSSLTDPYQLLNFRTGAGYDGQIYFANE